MSPKVLYIGYVGIAMGVFYSLFAVGAMYALLIAMASLPSIMILHFWQKDGRLFDSPFIMVFLTVLMGVTARSYVMVYLKDDLQVATNLWQDESISAYIQSTLLIALAVLAFSLAFFSKPAQTNKIAAARIWVPWRLFLLIILVSIASLYGMYVFFQQMNISVFLFGGDTLSKKSFLKLEEGQYKTSLTYLRLLSSQGASLLYLLLAYLQSKYRNQSWGGYWVILLFLMGLSIVFPFMTSSRSTALHILIVATLFLYGNQKVSSRTIVFMAVGALVLFWGMSLLRKAAYNSDVKYEFELASFAKGTVGSRNKLGLAKTAHIVEGVPAKMPFAFGSTYLYLMTAPIPRTAWVNKPPVLLGGEIQKYIYNDGFETAIPPGIVAESFLNFGILGVLLVPFMAGRISRNWLDWLYDKQEPFSYILYLIAIVVILDFFFSSGVNAAVVNTFGRMLPLLVMYRLVTVRKR